MACCNARACRPTPVKQVPGRAEKGAMPRHFRPRRFAVLALLLACACGSDPQPSAPPPPEAEAPVAPAAGPNQPPEVRSVTFEPDPPVPGERVTLRVAGSDPEGDELRFVYSWTLGGDRAGRDTALDLPQRSKGATLEVSVVAHDGRSESQAFTATTEVGNRAPKVLDLILEPANEIRVTDEIAASPRAEDPDGDPITFEYIWRVNGRRVAETGATLRSPNFKRGDQVEFQVRASDGEDVGEPLAAPPIEILNSPPVITSTPAGLDATGSFRYTPTVEDADGDRRIRFRLVEAPEGMSIDWLAGRIAWRPADDQAGEHPVTIEVDDSAGGITTQSFTISVALEGEDAASPAAPAP